MTELDIGIASYGSHEKLKRTISSLQSNSAMDWRCFVIDNPGPDPKTRPLIERIAAKDKRIIPVFLDRNVGYAGAVNYLLRRVTSEPGWSKVAYCDNDVIIETAAWDQILGHHLDAHPEIGMVFPNEGAYGMKGDGFTEIMWGVGFCWMTTRQVITEVGVFDEQIGHQNECDYCLRVRMSGYKCAAVPEVSVHHDAVASSDPAARERINKGVVEFVDKWNQYFCGKGQGYHSPNVLRWEDWPPNALYLERWWKERLPELNDNPETMVSDGRDYDLIRVPRLEMFYRGRIV